MTVEDSPLLSPWLLISMIPETSFPAAPGMEGRMGEEPLGLQEGQRWGLGREKSNSRAGYRQRWWLGRGQISQPGWGQVEVRVSQAQN